MDYKVELQNNNIDLNEVLNVINTLPETGSGGGDTFTTQSKIVSPTKLQQTVTPDSGYDGLSSVTVNAIPNEYITTTDATATSADIVNGKTAYVNGVKITGTHTCSSGSGGADTSDATATAEDIAQGKTAYINGGKVTGTMTVQSYYVSNVEPSASLGIDGDLCLIRAGE